MSKQKPPAKLNTAEREALVKKGKAMPGNRFPIRNCADLGKAVHAVGRARPNTPEERAKVRRFIQRRARELGCKVPDTWGKGGNLKADAQSVDLAEETPEQAEDAEVLLAGMVDDLTEQLAVTAAAPRDETENEQDEPRVNVSDRPKSDFPPSAYSSRQWIDATLIHLPPKPGQAGTDKGLHKLPIREPDGTINKAGVYAAAQTLAGARQGVNAPDAQRAEAAKVLVQIYRRDLREEPPESLVRLAGAAKGDEPEQGGRVPQPAKAKPSRILDALFAAAPTPTLAELSIDVDTPDGRVWPPPSDWFAAPQLTRPTPLTVLADGRVFGHLAIWGTQHLAAAGERVTPPRSHTGYSKFWRKMLPTSDGAMARVGFLTMDIGHAPLNASAPVAAAHYDNTEALAAAVSVGEDQHGIWVSGATLPHLDDKRMLKLSLATLSGDWRNGELCAALAVNVPGFGIPPVEEHRVDGEPLALVAAGAIAPMTLEGETSSLIDVPELASAIAAQLHDLQRTEAQKVRDEQEAQAQRDREQRRERARRSVGTRRARASASIAMSRLTDSITASARTDELDCCSAKVTDALIAACSLDESAGKNWVEKAGGLPDYVCRIAKHLKRKGMSTSHAVATAINAVKKMCSTGDLNFPGVQDVNAKSKAEASAAVARWSSMKAKS